ncbi:MAG: Ubiquitin-conjugating enzyme E2 6, partial [Paramarteilia canceri]
KKRIMIELKGIEKNKDLIITPEDGNLGRLHFTIEGPKDSIYEKGIYHGIIYISRDYPMTPIDFSIETPSGRFLVGVDICVTFTSFEPRTWNPAWSLEKLIWGIRSFFLDDENHDGGLEETIEKRIEMAEK